MANKFPQLPFDGQVFIDAFRMKWEFSKIAKCWQKKGSVPDIPAATELEPGLFTAQLKTLLDGVPKGGGHFGILTKPLLSLKPQKTNVLLADKVCEISDRNLSLDEWHKFIGEEIKYERTCPNLPEGEGVEAERTTASH